MAPRGASPTLALLGISFVFIWLYIRDNSDLNTRSATPSTLSQNLANAVNRFGREDPDRLALQSTEGLVCNPYDEPGHFIWTEQNSRTATWSLFPSSECSPAPDYFASIKLAFEETNADSPEQQKLKAQAIEETNFLRNKTLLILGDSVDRNALFHLSNLMGAGLWPSDYHNASLVGIAEGWDVRGVPHVLDQWQLAFRGYNGFFYGMVSLLLHSLCCGNFIWAKRMIRMNFAGK